MQKLIEHQFFCYPKNQNLSLLYKDANYLKSRLFLALSIQISPKNGFLLQLRKTKLGHFLSYFLPSSKIKCFFLENKSIKIGYKSNGKILLFGFDENENPVEVYKQNANGFWNATSFLGYSIIEEYTKKEYFLKREFIKTALEKRWQALEKGEDLHGDFTHFNILLSADKKVAFIDDKKVVNSKLFDHFYFYSYYVQCLERSKIISDEDVLEIKTDLQKLIKSICKLDSKIAFLTNLNIENAVGLQSKNRERSVLEFTDFFFKNER